MKDHKLGALFIALRNVFFIIGSFCAYRSPEILFNDISCILLNFDVKKKSTTIVPLRQVNATELSHENTKYICRMYLLVWIGLTHLNYVSEPDGIKFHFMNSATYLHIALKIWPKTVMYDHYLSWPGLSNFISKNSTTWPLNSRQTYSLLMYSSQGGPVSLITSFKLHA